MGGGGRKNDFPKNACVGGYDITVSGNIKTLETSHQHGHCIASVNVTLRICLLMGHVKRPLNKHILS